MTGRIMMAGALVLAAAACESPTSTRDDAREAHVVSGDSQTVVVGANLKDQIIVEVRDDNGRAVRGAQLFWLMNMKGGAAGGTIVAAQAETDEDGQAGAVARAGQTAGEYVVRVYAGSYENAQGDTVEINAEAVVFAVPAAGGN